VNQSVTEVVECPHCGEWVSPGAVCENCGGDLSGARVAVAEAPEKTAPKVAPKAVPDAVKPESAAAGANKTPSTTPGGEGKKEGSKTRHTESDPAVAGGCLFELEYNTARIFVSGHYSSFSFRLLPLSKSASKCRNIVLQVQAHHESSGRFEKRVYGVHANHPTPASINFRPTSPGVDIDSEVTLLYEYEGVTHRFTGSFFWDCADPNAGSGRMIENLIVDLKGTQANTAADQNIRILENFNPAKMPDPAETLKSLKLEPVWQSVPLFDRMPEGGRAERGLPVLPLSLRGPNERCVHIWSEAEVIFGRGRGNNAIRILPEGQGGKGTSLAAATSISRHHCTIRYHAGKYEITDGNTRVGTGKPSTNGTFLDGKRLQTGHWTTLANGVVQTLNLGAALPDEFKGVSFTLTALVDPQISGRSGGLVIRPIHDPFTVYLISQGSCDIQHLLNESKRVRIHTDGKRSVMDIGSTHFSLKHGEVLPDIDASWKVHPYESDSPKSDPAEPAK